ncbi:UDP-glucose 6-dehydrogenase TuaD [compost metagenome]
MKVCVIGTGYVGLVSGACLAEIGNDVICVDADREKIARLEGGEIPIYEPGLDELVNMNSLAGRLRFTSDLEEGVQASEVVFITVGTPPLPNGEPDLSAVEAVARGIGRALNGYKVIINKSTVPVGSGNWVAMLVSEGMAQMQRERVGPGGLSESDPAFDVVSNPEFLREGSAIHDSFFPDRIVIGSQRERAVRVMRELYAPVIERRVPGRGWDPLETNEVPFIVTDLTSAEMIKYAANAFLATKISFINEIANVCERVGADVSQVAMGMGLDRRIGGLFLNAGLGWGGSCFPKDVSALTYISQEYGYDAELLAAVQNVNRRQRAIALQKLQSHLKVLKGKTIALLGLAFKPNTDDLRDAPALSIAKDLIKLGARVKACDPIAGESAQKLLPSLVICEGPEEAAKGADAILIATEWDAFRSLDLGALRAALNPNQEHPLLLDGRNLLNPNEVRAAGFAYQGMGR